MPYLYINSKGVPWKKHSYSAGNDFDQCPYKYYLRRVLGWKEKDNKARFLFGRALEESIEFYHSHNGEGAVQDFSRRWAEYKDAQNIAYTDVEKNWETCLKIGTDMIRLYSAVQPKLPIPIGANSIFQREYAKEVFPGDPNYGEIEDAGKVDIVCYTDPKHPALIDNGCQAAVRPLIVDIKTSAVDFPEQQGIAAFDSQLRRYSWLTGIRDVAFLWFKKSPLGIKRGSNVTLLESFGNLEVGKEYITAKIDDDFVWLVMADFLIRETDKVKADEQQAWLEKNAVRVPKSSVTKQRLQFNSGIVTEQSAEDAGRNAARQIVQIVNCWKTGNWPQTFGIRYPRNDRDDAYFRAFVLGDEVFKQHNFVKLDEQSFDELFQED
ncbi:MAG TPA: PD-(D/E)XK nuclease family protein [Candidatus Paceibacterota bacterium]|jgi:hypothetical protein|nr:PD-(D/E)XK nuclease family protein [Candidatus Paceibacterota bacterium]